MGSFLQPRADLTDDEAGKLGMKNEDDEVEKFVQANTQELGKDMWLCPLSGKKFKGSDFGCNHVHLTERFGFVNRHLWLGNFGKRNRGLRARTLRLRYLNSSVTSPLS